MTKILALWCCCAAMALAQPYLQQGSKLVGSGAAGPASQGASIAVSADGSTAAVCGPLDRFIGATTSFVGSVWIFRRQAGAWSQDGPKIAPASGAGSVALSGDGNTLIIGSPLDGASGAAWIYTRGAGGWQQTAKLTGAGAVGGTFTPQLGSAVAISRDGNTAAVGAELEHDRQGAVWIFVRANGTWTQQGAKLTAAGSEAFGAALALTPEGDTLAIGAPGVADPRGGVYLYRRSNGAWAQTAGVRGLTVIPGTGNNQGARVAISDDATVVLAGGGEAAWAHVQAQGVWQSVKLDPPDLRLRFGTNIAVTVSADGKTAFLGAGRQDEDTGGVWLYRRSGTSWRSESGPFVGAGASGPAAQGSRLALSGDGSTLLVAGANDALFGNTAIGAGAVWVFAQPVATLTARAAPSPSLYGASVTLTAQVAPAAGATTLPPPTGTVQFSEGGTSLGSAIVSAGTATLITTTLAVGERRITAAYSGDSNWRAATSTLVHTVNAAPTSTTLALGVVNGSLALVASVSGGPGIAGAVQFLDATANLVLGTDNVSGSAARLILSPADFRAAVGHSITAMYAGDARFEASISATLRIPALVNAAGTTGTVFAPEEMASLFGTRLAGSIAPAESLPLPETLAGVSVTVTDSAGTARAAGMMYVSPGQVNFVLPEGLASGPAVISIRSGASTMPVPVEIAAVAPGVFARADGTAAAQILRSGTATVLVLYGTGIRNRSALDAVECRIGGETAAVLYAGPQGLYPGLDQVNVVLPERLRAAGVVKVELSVDGNPANVTTFSFQ